MGGRQPQCFTAMIFRHQYVKCGRIRVCSSACMTAESAQPNPRFGPSFPEFIQSKCAPLLHKCASTVSLVRMYVDMSIHTHTHTHTHTHNHRHHHPPPQTVQPNQKIRMGVAFIALRQKLLHARSPCSPRGKLNSSDKPGTYETIVLRNLVAFGKSSEQ